MPVSGLLSPENVSEATRALDLSGVFANGMLGGVLARERDLDLFGFLVIGVVSGLGGGIIRDTLLQHGTPVALTDYTYLTVAVAGTLLSFLFDVSRHTSGRAFNLLDATALSVWGVAGAQKTLAVGLGWLPAVLLGTITAVGGGAVRDLLLGEMPRVLGGRTLYATVAALAGAVMVVCSRLGAPVVGILAGVVTGTLLRLASLSWGLSFGSGRIRERGLVPCLARRRRAAWRSHGNRRQRREVRCQTPRARHDPNERPQGWRLPTHRDWRPRGARGGDG